MGQGRGEWIADLAERHGRMVFATAYRILGQAADAEDVLQEVFLRLLAADDGRLRCSAVRDWGAYLRVTASRAAVDLLRRQRRWGWTNEPLDEQTAVVAEEDPAEAASRRDRAQLLREALGELPDRDAEVFALRYFEDFSYQQIAVHLELSVTQVGVILHRARARLRTLVTQAGLDKGGEDVRA